MDFDSITALITTVGFPIFCCIIMFKQNSELQKTLVDISLTMQSLVTKIDQIEKELK